MPAATRRQVLDTLQNDWAAYVDRFRRMPDEAQADFLDRQGYHRLGDLLAHVIAWWEKAIEAIETLQEEPNYQEPDVDVDAFNRDAVERFQEGGEAEIVRSFEQMRFALIDLVSNLEEAAFSNQQVAERLNIEVIGHLEEHALPVEA